MMKFEVSAPANGSSAACRLIKKVDTELAVDLELFTPRRPGNPQRHRAPGLCRAGRRPVISKPRKLALVARAAWANSGERQGQSGRTSNAKRRERNPHLYDFRLPTGAHPSWTPAPAQLAIAYSVCRGITRTSAKNFYYAFHRSAQAQARRHCAPFMPSCAGATTSPTIPVSSVAERRNKLDTWLDALHRVQQGQPSDDPILLALTDAQRRFTIPAGLLDDLAPGTAMDVGEIDLRRRTPSRSQFSIRLEDLKLYCYRVASVVGLVCIHIFGYRDPAAEPLAEQCGLAFQLTNIIRDVKEDAAMGRIYLPEEDLAKFNLTAADILATPDPARLRPLLELEAAPGPRRLCCRGSTHSLYLRRQPARALGANQHLPQLCWRKSPRNSTTSLTAKVSLDGGEKLRILFKGFLQRITLRISTHFACADGFVLQSARSSNVVRLRSRTSRT